MAQTTETSPERIIRVTREEMFPKVGEPTEPLKALVPTFTEKLIQGVIESFDHGCTGTELKLIGTGEHPQTLIVRIEKPEEGLSLRVTVEGDWENKPHVPAGLPIIADFKGKFYRKRKPEDPDPIAEVGTILEPRTPFGLGSRGKNNYWYLRLPSREFPKGGKVAAFVQPSGEDVEKGQTILLYVDPF